MGSPFAIRQLDYKSDTTFATTFGNASAFSGTKLPILSYDASGLEYGFEPDPGMQTRRYARQQPVPGQREGSFTFSTPADAGASDNTANIIATFLSKIMGGIQTANDSDRSITLDDSGTGGPSHSTSRIYAASGTFNSEVVGSGIMLGTRGDGKGNGEVRRISAVGTEGSSDYADVDMLWSGTPADTDVAVIATTVYLDPDATQEYIDFLAMGHPSNVQRQMISCQGVFELQSLAPGEKPRFMFTMTPADWEWSTSNLGTLSSTVPSKVYPGERGLGGLFLQDNGSTGRTVFKGGDVALPSFMEYVPDDSHNGVNGKGGWTKMPTSPIISLTLQMDEDMPGLYNDFANEAVGGSSAQAKQLMVQYGHTKQQCFAIDIPKCYLLGDPKETDLNGLAAVRITLQADEAATSGTDLARSPIRFHFF